MNKYIEPPLGITPIWIEDMRRLSELRRAIAQYTAEHMVIPIEWVEEYNDLTLKKARGEE